MVVVVVVVVVMVVVVVVMVVVVVVVVVFVCVCVCVEGDRVLCAHVNRTHRVKKRRVTERERERVSPGDRNARVEVVELRRPERDRLELFLCLLLDLLLVQPQLEPLDL
jgi:hypothetical protein